MVLSACDRSGARKKYYQCSSQCCHSMCHEIVSGYNGWRPNANCAT
jgi:hypothetical protein